MKKMYKRKGDYCLFSIFMLFTLFVNPIKANNMNVSNISLSDNLDNVLVRFDISWENSWRTSTLESNWDAAWIFVKWRLKNSRTWNHATLNTSGHTAPAGSTITTPSDGKGVFMYKSADGIGTNTWTAAKVSWNYISDGVADAALVEVCVFAIEMVYIPSGAFYVGDGTTTNVTGQFQVATSNAAFQITSEAAITLGGSVAGNMRNNGTSGQVTADDFSGCGVCTQTLPAAFPKGFNAFYIMKYELTQGQFVEYLNRLSFAQQVARTIGSVPDNAPGSGAMSATNANRNGIDIMTSGVNPNTPAVYACNLNGNGVYNEADDGQNIPANFLSYRTLASYLDWSGLRPMTELEYEKACRGAGIAAVANEFAWGNTTLTSATGFSNSGAANESASNAGANVTSNNIGGVQGPIRAGAFALATNRQNSGASYYGVMELSGNLYERCITVGNATGRAFTGVHGDGSLNASAEHNVANWPGNTAVGANFRGGTWNSNPNNMLRVSDRYYGAFTDTAAGSNYGGRGVRTAP